MKALFIDTRDNKNVKVRLVIDGKEYTNDSENVTGRPESVLNLIDGICKDAGIDIQDIDEIQVEEGPGSYTGLKVGASVANALSFALDKRVNNKKIGEIVEPRYE